MSPAVTPASWRALVATVSSQFVTGLVHLCVPRRQRCLCSRRIGLDAIHGLPAQSSCLCNGSDATALAKHVLHRRQLRVAIARLAPTVAVALGFCVLNA